MQVYHPNIDSEGNVCLNILREDWKPVLSISSLIYGLQFLFLVRSAALPGCRALCRQLCSAVSLPLLSLRWTWPAPPPPCPPR